ncbi:enhancer of polycomb homolog 2 isoform X1 [Micropterus dolomieu]|uniref:enhancer of polycomb homolog 2 isoform X1 n=1 Tax=Micropterus dolomieu TaxID=147949 RepID=UPI001E8D726D|nr:enhancer of polycomb homolog 2 isoform X1 [Micropterus dolomieu]
MSKLSFRARALDASKALPVYRNRDLPDLTDCVSINRAVPQMPTGMEKEEELEHHLQRAISAQQVFREKKETMVIPVPEAETNTTYYDRLYKGEVRVPKQLIHIQPMGLDLEQPDYDMDSEDETLLNRLNRKMEIKPLQFETMVDRLEKASTNQVDQLVSLSEAKLLLNEDDYLLKAVYDYWVRKRKNCGGPSLIPHIKQEKRDGSTNSDAYVAFRRRTEKMQTRKNRKNDEASYEKMLRLRREFSRTVTILEMIKRREKSKRELLHLTLEVVERRYQMGDFSGDALRAVSLPLVEKPAYSTAAALSNGIRHKADVRIKVQKKPTSIRDELPFDPIRPKKNLRRDRPCPPQRRPGRPPGPFTINRADIKQYDFHSSGDDDSPPPPPSPPSSSDEESSPDGVFVFRRKAGCQYLSPGTEQTGGVDGPELLPQCLRHCLTELTRPPHWTGLSRRRIGRGGRIILDRASSGLDPVLRQLDSFTHTVCRTGTSTCLLSDPVRLELNPPLSSGTTTASLTEILNNIQTLRRFCFRPRPVQEQGEGGRRTTGSSVEDRRLPCPLSPESSCGSAGGITEEQYHSHQQQLVQMQKQQLEQLQNQNTTSYRHTALHRTQSSRSSESSSKTLDSASAQFAASAVISAPPPHGHTGSENRPYKTGVNGVLHPPGPSRPPYSSSSSLSRLGLSARGSLPSSSSPRSLPNQRSQAGAVSPAHPHPARPSAPPTSALKLATSAASLDRVPKVSTARDPHEPERILNGLSETTLPMEVT